jgi:hypothetical protein
VSALVEAVVLGVLAVLCGSAAIAMGNSPQAVVMLVVGSVCLGASVTIWVRSDHA